ncbi:MAG: hypothetical protein AB7V27_15290 [Candidatus Binatia bacterium]
MSLWIFCFFPVLLALGATVYEACMGRAPAAVESRAPLLHILLAGVLVLSLLAVLLLQLGAFQLRNLLIAAALASSALFAWRRRLPKLTPGLRIGRGHIALLLIAVGALALRFPPSNWVAGAIDHGVYLNVANNIRHTGRIFIHDELSRPELTYHTYYTQNSYIIPDATTESARGTWFKQSCFEGLYMPGIYVQDFADGLLVPQFYHLHPLWMAIAGSLFGQEHSTLSMPVFALLSIVVIYALTLSVAGNTFAAVSAALLLAANPLHSYLSKLPLTEVPALFFFFTGLYFFVRLLKADGRDRLNGIMTVLAFACLFLTRISGFLHIAALLCFMAYVLAGPVPSLRRPAILWTLAGVIAVYAYSVLYGHVFSCAYSSVVYNAYFGTDFSTWAAKGALAFGAAGLSVVYMVLHRHRERVQLVLESLRPWSPHIAFILLAGVIACGLLVAYRFVFDIGVYGPELRAIGIDPTTSAKLWGADVAAAWMLNYTVLMLLITPIGLVIALHGVYRLLQTWPTHPHLFLCGFLALYFLAVNTVMADSTRYLYYFARYLMSETIPLLIIAGAISLARLRTRMPALAIAVLCAVSAPSIALSYLHSRDTELKHFYGDVQAIAASLPEGSVVFVDRSISPDWRWLSAPMKLSFGLTPFWYIHADLVEGRLDDVVKGFVAENRPVFVITNERNLDTEYFSSYRKMPIRLNLMVVKNRTVPVGFAQSRLDVMIYRPTERLLAQVRSTQGNVWQPSE